MKRNAITSIVVFCLAMQSFSSLSAQPNEREGELRNILRSVMRDAIQSGSNAEYLAIVPMILLFLEGGSKISEFAGMTKEMAQQLSAFISSSFTSLDVSEGDGIAKEINGQNEAGLVQNLSMNNLLPEEDFFGDLFAEDGK